MRHPHVLPVRPAKGAHATAVGYGAAAAAAKLAGAADAPDLDLNLDFVDNEWIRELFSDTGLVSVHVTS